MQTYDVAVVGAGVVGAAAAAALAAAQLSVAVVTGGRTRAAGSATAASGGLVRCYEPEPYRRALALRSHELLWRRCGESNGGRLRERIGHTITGSLVCLTAEETEKAEAVLEEFADHDVPAELLSPRQIANRWPTLGTAGIVAGLWEPSGGYADPPSTAGMYLNQARWRSATVVNGHVHGLIWDGDRVCGVTTSRGDVVARSVVLAAGCGSLGLLPPRTRGTLRTRRVRYALVGWPDRSVPTVMDHVTGMWGRPFGTDRLLVGRPVDEWDVQPGAGTEITPEQMQYIRDGGVVRWPQLRTAPLRGARWGTDLYTPADPWLGPVDAHPGLVLATAWSGAGFKTAPAAGEAVVHSVREVLGE